MVPRRRFDPDQLTDVQIAFLMGLTDQRIANIWEAADSYADLSTEAKGFLRNADKSTMKWLAGARPEEIEELQRGIKVMEASKLLTKFLLFLLSGAILTVFDVWQKLAAFLAAVFRVKT